LSNEFDALLAEAQVHPFTGWDFSWIQDRVISKPLPWHYSQLVAKHARESPDMLDLGTGGGEVLAKLPHPRLTVATEAYTPNVRIAAGRLHPLGIAVVHYKGAPDNIQQKSKNRTILPFKDSSFHLVISRHEAYQPKEISRILVREGHFVTQQVGEQRYHDFHRLLEKPPPRQPRQPFDLRFARSQLETAGLQVTDSGEGLEVKSFLDIGAFAWYLKAVPWVVEGFSIPKYRRQLMNLNTEIKTNGSLTVRFSRFWLDAVNLAR
jgi:SAM-dependent methyltransferase